MNIQNFQSFFSNFLRLNVSIEYNDDTKLEKLHDKLSIELKDALSNNFREFTFLIEVRIEFTKIYNSRKRMKKQRVEEKIARLFRLEYIQFKFNFVVSRFIFFVKSIISTFFTKFTIHFHVQSIIKNYDSIIDKLINIDQCYICDEIEHIWKICFNAHKHKQRQWHDMQMIQMNMIFDFNEFDFDSKN